VNLKDRINRVACWRLTALSFSRPPRLIWMYYYFLLAAGSASNSFEILYSLIMEKTDLVKAIKDTYLLRYNIVVTGLLFTA
jgi:hypothetical protein